MPTPELYPYQGQGVEWLLARPRSYLADQMGLGKTLQACEAARRLSLGPEDRVLIVAPASVLPHWEEQWRSLVGPDPEPLLVSYDRWREDHHRHYLPWALVILDEAHYCKEPTAQRTYAALKAARNSDRAWLLSGTPMPNHPGELWAPIRALWPRIPLAMGIRNRVEWFHYFCRYTYTRYGPKPYAIRNADRLRPYLQKILLRRTWDEVGLDLPPLRVDLQLLPDSDDFRKAFAEEADALTLLDRMAQEEGREDQGGLSRLRRLLGNYKTPRIAEEIARELREESVEKIVVLAYHHDTLAILAHALGPFGLVSLTGASSDASRREAVRAFREEPQIRVFLGQQQAAGVGLNLQVAHEIVLVEPSWVPDENNQAVARIHRIGQDKPCRARIFGVAGTLDAAVMRTVARKTEMKKGLGL